MTDRPTGTVVNVTVVIPALNEERKISDTLKTVLAVADQSDMPALELLVVDDGSTDGTADKVLAQAATDPRIRLLRNPRNLGLGASFKRGIQEARGGKLMIVPGDNDMPAHTLRELLLHVNDADLVMCYFPDRAQRGPLRRALSATFGLIYATAFHVHVQYINGPCLYPVARLRELNLFSNRFSIVAEINVKLLRQGVSFCEIAGTRQTGLEGSTSFSVRNLREAANVFCRLWYEIHWTNRSRFRGRPRRVVPATALHS